MNSRCSSPQCLYPSRVHATPLSVFLIAACAILMSCSEQGSTSLFAPGILNSSGGNFSAVSTVAFVSTRDDPTNPNPSAAAEIYLIEGDGTNPRRLTWHDTAGDGFAALSPDGKRIGVQQQPSATTEGEPPKQIGDLFLMNTDGTELTWVVQGRVEPQWSPDSKDIAFHASASGTGLPIKPDPGAATFDSDIFVVNVDDALANVTGARVRTSRTAPTRSTTIRTGRLPADRSCSRATPLDGDHLNSVTR